MWYAHNVYLFKVFSSVHIVELFDISSDACVVQNTSFVSIKTFDAVQTSVRARQGRKKIQRKKNYDETNPKSRYADVGMFFFLLHQNVL